MAGLTRDRVTWLVYSYMSVYGYFLYGFGPTVPLIGSDLDVSRAVAGLHGTALAVGAVLAGLAGPTIVRRVGRGTALRGGLLGLAVGLVGYLVGDSAFVTLAGTLVAGTGGSLVVNSHSAVLSHQHPTAGPAAITEANALAAGFGLIAPAVIGLTAAVGLGWRAGLLVAGVAALAVAGGTARIVVPAGPPVLRGGRRGGTPLPAPFRPALSVLVLCIAAEFSLTFWSSELIRDRTGAGSAVATAAISALVLGMTCGRAAGGRLAVARGVDPLLAASLIVTMLGFTVLWLSTTLWLSVAGLLVVGLGLSVQFPLAISRLLAAAGGHPDRATAKASIGAGIAIGTAPFLLGLLADRFGVHQAFLLVPLLLAAAAALLRFSATAAVADRPDPDR